MISKAHAMPAPHHAFLFLSVGCIASKMNPSGKNKHKARPTQKGCSGLRASPEAVALAGAVGTALVGGGAGTGAAAGVGRPGGIVGSCGLDTEGVRAGPDVLTGTGALAAPVAVDAGGGSA
jgi:hypothetical protein